MERRVIEETVVSLPAIELANLHPGNGEVWEEQDGGAYLILTRRILDIPNQGEMIVLTIDGELSERSRVAAEFGAVFGEPAYQEREPIIDTLAWRCT